MLVVGSSLMVYSAFRLSKAAKAGNGRLAILSAGPTRADDMADLKVLSRVQDAGRILTDGMPRMVHCSTAACMGRLKLQATATQCTAECSPAAVL